MIAVGGDLVESFKVLADDDIEAAIAEIDAFEEETCGIPHSEDAALPDGATREIEPDAAHVDVHATDTPSTSATSPPAARRSCSSTTAPRPTSSRSSNSPTASRSTKRSRPKATTGPSPDTGTTGLAAPGGDEEAITFDLEPGNYALACYIPSADGTLHLCSGCNTSSPSTDTGDTT